jgi:oligopeptide/dipeptide ABC transporter ATP-binding protein
VPAALSVRDLRVRFRQGHNVVHAVNGLSFSLERGRVLAIVGESGSGKSVTCLALMGLLPAAAEVSGSALLGSVDLLTCRETDIRRLRGQEIALVYQDPMAALNPMRTIGAQLKEPLKIHLGMRGRVAAERAVELLGMVGLPTPRQQLRSYPHQLSGGMRQRVLIAMALACGPQVLLADEPTTALDVSIQAQILELLTRLCSDLNISLVLVSHDLGVVAGIADEVLVMYGGFKVEHGAVDRLFTHSAHPYTRGLLNSIPDVMSDANAPLTGIPGQPPDLRVIGEECIFRPRCPDAFDRCAERPQLQPAGPDHEVACWAALQATPAEEV